MDFRFIIFDIDGTLTKEDNSWKLIHTSLNVFEKAKAHRELFFNREINYQKWADLDVSLWKNVHVNHIEKVLDSVPLNEGIDETISELKIKNYIISLLSSGISLLANKLKRRFGFDYSIANKVLIDDKGYLTGKVLCNVAYNNKDLAISGLLKTLNISFLECIAIGDNENDLNIFKKVGRSIAFNPKSFKIEKAADFTVYGSDLRLILKHIP